MNPDGGPAIPVSVNTDRAPVGGTAIPVYGYASAPTDGRPAQAGAAIPVRVLTAADLVQNGGTWVLEGRTAAMPVYTAPASSGVIGGPAIAVYPINAWPPSNVTPAWAPSDLAGLALWLKSDAGLFQDAAKTTPAVADTDPVGAWADQSGNGKDAVQATAGKRPVLKLNILNGRAIVRHDGADDLLTSTLRGTAVQTLAMVVRDPIYNIVDPPAGFVGMGGVGFDAYNGEIGFQNQTADGYIYYGGNPNNWTLWIFRFNSVDSLNARRNAVAVAAQNPSDGYVNQFWSTGYTGAYGHLDIGEMLVYDTALSDANCVLLEAYLNTRWAVY